MTEPRRSDRILTAIQTFASTLSELGIVGEIFIIGEDMHAKIFKTYTEGCMMKVGNIDVMVARKVEIE